MRRARGFTLGRGDWPLRGFVVRTEAQKAAWDNGFRLDRGMEDGWLHYASTTAPGSVWIAGASQRGPWLLSIDHLGVSAEVGTLVAAPIAGPRW